MKRKLAKCIMIPLVLLSFMHLQGASYPSYAEEGQAYHEDMDNDFSMYAGIWLGAANNNYDYIDFDDEGNWWLYAGDEVVDEGWLQYEPEWEGVYAYSSLDGGGSRVVWEGDQLYITSFGYFHYGGEMEYYWYIEGGGDHDGPPQG